MKDQYNRTIDYVRISLTDQCNLSCVYCMPGQSGQCQRKATDEAQMHARQKAMDEVQMHAQQKATDEALMQTTEILHLAALFAKAGVKKVKLTGGEPLLRQDIPELIRGLKELCGINQVTLTTNGVLLEQKLEQLVAAGLDGVNISLDSLDAKRYEAITGRNCLPHVSDSIRAALSYDSLRVKLNCVPVGTAEDVTALAALAKDTRLLVRFIELMPIGQGKTLAGMRKDEILSILEKAYGTAVPYQKQLGNGPAVYYDFPGFCGKIGLIAAVSGCFCTSCSRIRLTADGKVKGCLQYEAGADLKKALRAGASDEALFTLITDAIYHKPKEHCFFEEAGHSNVERHPMSEIGG